jgi:hypothetical protein
LAGVVWYPDVGFSLLPDTTPITPHHTYLPPTLSIFSLPALEDLFLLPLSIFPWVFPFFSTLPVLK